MTFTGTTSFTLTANPQTDNLYLSSPFTFRLNVALTTYNSITGVILFTVNVNRYLCISSTPYSTTSSINASYTYYIGTPALTITAPTYTSGSFTCAETVTYALRTQPDDLPPTGWVTFDPATKVVTITTTDVNLHSSTAFNLRIKITRSQSNVTTNLDFAVTLNNPCLTTTVTTSSITIAAITTGVDLTHITASYAQVADSAATTHGVPNLCGARTYEILDTDDSLVTTWASTAGTTTFTITIAPNADSLWSNTPRSMKLKTTLTSYNTKTGNTPFSLTINQYVCTSGTSYSQVGTAMLTSKTQIIGDAAFEFTANLFSTSPYTCSETATYSLIKQDGTAAPSAIVGITPSSRVVRIFTTDVSTAGTYTLRVRVTRTQGGASNLDWTLTLTDPCPDTTITTTDRAISNISVKVGLTATTTFTEFLDAKGTLYSFNTLCGARTYTVIHASDSALVNWAAITGTGPYTITFSPVVDNLHTTPDYNMKLKIMLTNYTSKTAEVAFTVTVAQYECTS